MTTPRTARDLRWLWIASELLLVATTVASVRLLERLYQDTTFLAPMLFAAIVCHAVLIAMRWFGFGAAVSGLVSFVAVVFAAVATHYSTTATAVIVPTGATIDQFQADLEIARDLFNSLTTPVPAVTGFVVAGSLIFWLLAFAADLAAFRLFSPGQALVPALTVLIFVSLLGVEDNRVQTTAVLVVSGVLFVLAHRAATRALQGIWLDAGPVRGYSALMIAGGVVSLVAALAGVLGGPAVPGADEAPLVEIGNEGRRENRPIEVISPLVQIQPRLVDQSDEELFSVETDQRAYWRIAALDIFDGTLWRSQGQFGSAGGSLEVAFPSNVPITNVSSVFDLGPLNVVWAPSPYLPVGIQNLGDEADINFEPESATFIVDTKDQRVSNGLRYRIDAEVADLTGGLLRELSRINAEQTIDPRYLSLPADYSPFARAEAERIAAGLDNTYDKALALQNYFRDNFTYDIDVAKGHDIERLDDFLTIQRGYCEQFAGTFASMARSIGIPSRVATGFTPGDQDPSNPNRYVVRGRHAHAWPEVWIAGAGWVAFEPTPGRGAPNATEYTGVPESQDSGGDDSAEDADERAAAALPTPTPIPPDFEEFEALEVPADLVLPEEAAEGPGSRSIAPIVLLAMAAAVVAWAIGVPALKSRRERRRRERLADDTRRLVALEWAALVDRFDLAGHPPRTNETLLEYSDRVQRDFPVAAPAFGELTELAVVAAYDGDPPAPADVERASALARRIGQDMTSQQPWVVRSAHGVDPRPLLRWKDPVVDRCERLAAGAISVAEDDPAAEELDPLVPKA